MRWLFAPLALIAALQAVYKQRHKAVHGKSARRIHMGL